MFVNLSLKRPIRRVYLAGRPRPTPPSAATSPVDTWGNMWLTSTPKTPEQESFYQQWLGEPWEPAQRTYLLADGTEVPWDDQRAVDDRTAEITFQQDVRRDDARIRQEAIEMEERRNASPYELPDGRTVRYDHPDAAADREKIRRREEDYEIPF